MPHFSFHSPVGDLTLFEEDDQIVSLDWGRAAASTPSYLLLEAKRQLDLYFEGLLRVFNLPLSPLGTDFQREVCLAMSQIPYGQTRSYGDLARDVGSAARAVGQACSRNSLPILIPCHRVLAANGALGGYSGIEGIDTKRYLLGLEGVEIRHPLPRRR